MYKYTKGLCNAPQACNSIDNATTTIGRGRRRVRERKWEREEAVVTNETTTATTENYIHFRLPASRSRSVADTLLAALGTKFTNFRHLQIVP